MRKYQDADPLHGNGKAMPKPKRHSTFTRRGMVHVWRRPKGGPCCIFGHGVKQ